MENILGWEIEKDKREKEKKGQTIDNNKKNASKERGWAHPKETLYFYGSDPYLVSHVHRGHAKDEPSRVFERPLQPLSENRKSALLLSQTDPSVELLSCESQLVCLRGRVLSQHFGGLFH